MVRDSEGQGIWFGPDGLHIPLAASSEQLAKCKLGPYYARMPDGGKSLFAVGENARGVQLVGLRAYVAEGKGERELRQPAIQLGGNRCGGACGVLPCPWLHANWRGASVLQPGTPVLGSCRVQQIYR